MDSAATALLVQQLFKQNRRGITQNRVDLSKKLIQEAALVRPTSFNSTVWLHCGFRAANGASALSLRSIAAPRLVLTVLWGYPGFVDTTVLDSVLYVTWSIKRCCGMHQLHTASCSRRADCWQGTVLVEHSSAECAEQSKGVHIGRQARQRTPSGWTTFHDNGRGV